jgi:hypothetical protein
MSTRVVTRCSVSFNVQQDRQHTHNVTLRRVRATIIAVKKEWVFHICSCFCSLKYAACNAHAPYCHLRPVRLNNIFPHYLINCKIFEKKKILNIKRVVSFGVQLLFETFIILKRTERVMIIILYFVDRAS